MARSTSVVMISSAALVALMLSLAAVDEVAGLYLCPNATTTLAAMEPCMPSVEGKVPFLPNEDCCIVVRTTEPGCLCVAFTGYRNSSSINVKAALALPQLCGKVIPQNFTCNGEPVPSGN